MLYKTKNIFFREYSRSKSKKIYKEKEDICTLYSYTYEEIVNLLQVLVVKCQEVKISKGTFSPCFQTAFAILEYQNI